MSARLLMDQGITPTLITFTSPFFPPDKALASAAALGLPVTLVNIYDDLLPLIKNPPHGLGKNLNPCIDCHALMFRKAGEFLGDNEPGFLFSGEVIGQRPMSQNPKALKEVAQDSGHWGRVLRPLSAKLLPPTEAEEKGWVDRERLLGLNGRGRRLQINLAESYGLAVPAPAGGCLLTDVGYAARLKWLMTQPQAADDQAWPPERLAELLKRGRLFSADPGQWLAVGRNKADNEHLNGLVEDGDMLFHLEGAPGPTVLCPALGEEPGEKTLQMGKSLAAAYGDNGGQTEVTVKIEIKGRGSRLEQAAVTPSSIWTEFMVPPSS